MWGKKRKEEAIDALQKIPFNEVAGKETTESLTIFALSTCGFCRRALAFLDEHGYAYRYVHMDKLPKDQQDIIRSYIKTKFKIAISFPFLMLGEHDFLTGFIRASWEKELHLKE